MALNDLCAFIYIRVKMHGQDIDPSHALVREVLLESASTILEELGFLGLNRPTRARVPIKRTGRRFKISKCLLLNIYRLD